MSDPADLAQPEEEARLKAALFKALSAKPQLPYRGSCYNCEEPLPKGLRFCPDDDGLDTFSECRDDYEYRVNRKKSNGNFR